VSVGRRFGDIILLLAMTVFWAIVFVILSGPIASLVVLLMDR
jgi:hypothetical protein